MEKEVLFQTDSYGVEHITLNRPDFHNALNPSMLELLRQHLQLLQQSPHIKAVVLKGNGKSFCAGADLSHMKNIATYSRAENIQDALVLSDVLELLNTLPMPTITYAQGAVMGGGLGLLSVSDIVIADEETKYAFSEVKLGIIPAMISPYVVKAIGVRQARKFFLTGERFNTPEAIRIGLVHQSCKPEQTDAFVNQHLNTILQNGCNAVIEAKKLLQKLSGEISINLRLELAELLATLRESDEGQNMLSAFLNRDR